MTRHLSAILTIGLLACGGSTPPAASPAGGTGTITEAGDDGGGGETESGETTDGAPAETKKKKPVDDAGEFQVGESDKSSRPGQAKLKATKTEAAVRLFVVDKDKGPIPGIVISLSAPTGKKYYAPETDADGFTEVLLPIGQTYDVVYLSLGRHSVSAQVKVANEPNLNLKLTIRYKREDYQNAPVAAKPDAPPPPAPRFVLDGVEFATGKATLTGDSHTRLDAVLEYMTYKKSARIEISGHTDNVGKPASNKKLSQQRAEAVRDYLVSKGIDPSRIEAVGYGDEKPVASNKTADGRQRNRRIEATEL